jgi:hypothetical protein
VARFGTFADLGDDHPLQRQILGGGSPSFPKATA